MNRKPRLVTAALLAAISLSFSTQCSRSPGQKATQSPIRIGVVLPLTGDTAEYGTRCKDGVQLAVAEINSTGGVGGTTVQAVYEDYGGKPQEGVAAMQRLCSQRNVAAIVGPVESSVALAMLPLANQYKTVVVSPTASSPDLSGRSRFFFRVWPSDIAEAKAIATFAFERLGVRRAVVLYVNNDYGVGLLTHFRTVFSTLGGQVLGTESYMQGDPNLRPMLAKLAALHPEAFYLVGYHKDLALATKLLRELGSKAQILGSANYGTPELLSIAGSAAEGAIYANPAYDPTDPVGSVEAFRKLYEESRHGEPTMFEANGYDSVMVLAAALRSGARGGEQIAGFISSLSGYQGASGTLSFDKNGDVTKPISIFTVENGKFEPYVLPRVEK